MSDRAMVLPVELDLLPSQSSTRVRAVQSGDGPANGEKGPPGQHLVHFYEEQGGLSSAVAKFLAEGIRNGDAIIVIATEAHTAAFRSQLAAMGHDVDAEIAAGRAVVLDAHETLAKLMRDGEPDRASFEATVGAQVAAMSSQLVPPAKLRAYGEMVDVLWRDGHRQAALRLEGLWNDLQCQHPFTLLCAYAMAHFFRQSSDLTEVCATHSHFHAEDGATWAADRNATSLFSQHARRLEKEIAHREEIEKSLRESLRKLHAKEDLLRRSEEKAGRSEEQLRDFVENGALGLHRIGPDGTILWANRAELELLGYEEHEYVGHNIADFHADEGAIRDILERLTRGETLHDYEARLRTKSGAIKCVLISSNVYSRDGKFVHTRCYTRDITERKTFEQFRADSAVRAERLLKITAAIASAVSAEQVFEALVDHMAEAVGASSSGLWLVDEEAPTARLMRARGYSEAAMQRLETLDLQTSLSMPIIDAIRGNAPVWIASQGEMLERYPHLGAMATAGRTYRVACLPLISHRRALGALGITIEEEREESGDEREFLLLIASYASQAIERLRLFEAEHRSRADVSRLYEESAAARVRAEQLYRFAQSVMAADRVEVVFEAALTSIKTALGANRAAILTFDTDGVMRFRAWRDLTDTYRSAVEGHSPWSSDAREPEAILVEDAKHDPAMAAYAPLFESEGIGSLAFIPLVTGNRLLGKFMVYYEQPHAFTANEVETARAIANHLASVIDRFDAMAKLEETVKHNELFAGILGHDLRGPLNAMMMASQLLLMRGDGAPALDEREAKPLRRILSSGHRMTKMIEQLLDFTRARSGGGIRIEPCDTRLGELCAQAIAEVELANPDWKIQRETLGDQRGSWDADRLLQVFSNLISNAGQHGTPEAPVLVKLDGTDRAQVTIEVRNGGVIPEALLPNLFEPFRGTQQRRDAFSQGLGLGLFIVREIIRGHGGSIHVSSSEADGTSLVIRLPRHARKQ